MSDESDVDVDETTWATRLDDALDGETADVIEDAQAAIDEARRRVAEVPAEVVITNHVMGLYELAAIHLSADQPDLASAALAIDAVACLVDGLGDRLGAEAVTMRDALANIRIAFVQIKGRAAPPPPPTRARSAPDPRGADHAAAEAADGASTTRPLRTVTPSARSSAAWPAAGSVARRPSARTTRHHGRSRSVPAEQRADGPGPAGEPGVVGDVAVADDLTLAEGHDHVDDPLLQLGHGSAAAGAGWRPRRRRT